MPNSPFSRFSAGDLIRCPPTSFSPVARAPRWLPRARRSDLAAGRATPRASRASAAMSKDARAARSMRKPFSRFSAGELIRRPAARRGPTSFSPVARAPRGLPRARRSDLVAGRATSWPRLSGCVDIFSGRAGLTVAFCRLSSISLRDLHSLSSNCSFSNKKRGRDVEPPCAICDQRPSSSL